MKMKRGYSVKEKWQPVFQCPEYQLYDVAGNWRNVKTKNTSVMANNICIEHASYLDLYIIIAPNETYILLVQACIQLICVFLKCK
jgi:hypothetical protein